MKIITKPLLLLAAAAGCWLLQLAAVLAGAVYCWLLLAAAAWCLLLAAASC